MQEKKMMKVSEIMRDYKSSYMDGSWQETISMFKSHSSDSEIMQKLQKVLQKDGGYREPITLEEYFNEETGETEKYVADGTHRLLSAHLIGFEEVLVQQGYPKTNWNEGYLKTTFTIKSEIDEDRETDLLVELRSFEIDENNWVTYSGCSTISGEHNFYWCSSDENLIPAINYHVSKKVKEYYGEGIENIETKWEPWEED